MSSATPAAAPTPPAAIPEPPRTGLRRISLTQWIIISMVIGVAIGYLFPAGKNGAPPPNGWPRRT